ncbi:MULTISPECIES: YxeA family protein [unclassified Enterococcus]|jgi:uncharacterized protein (TIGR01655 family)|uniref:YxeA family protein n=1 Tax=unclassified Enterococcus TaxID=2608891 RepID=UPI000352E844|nr:hypothetical protein D920_01778 [Enterococcus faecalis 13-SD-W-01]
MKKLLWGLVITIILIFGAYKITEMTVMGGDTYYVQITTDGQKEVAKDDKGQEYVSYGYSLPGFKEDGSEKTMEFKGMNPRPLKKDAYLKITWNKSKGVTGYEEVKKADVPKKAAEKLEEEK